MSTTTKFRRVSDGTIMFHRDQISAGSACGFVPAYLQNDSFHARKLLTKDDAMHFATLDKGSQVDWDAIAEYWGSKRTDQNTPIYVHGERTLRKAALVSRMLREEPEEMDIGKWDDNWNEDITCWEDWFTKFVKGFDPALVNLSPHPTHPALKIMNIGSIQYLVSNQDNCLLSDEPGEAKTLQDLKKKYKICLVRPVYSTRPDEILMPFGAKVPTDGSKGGKNPSIEDRKLWLKEFANGMPTSRLTDEGLKSAMEEVYNDLIVNEAPQMLGTLIATPFNGGVPALTPNGIESRVGAMEIKHPTDVIQSTAIVARCDGGVYDSERSPMIDNAQVNDDFTLWEVEPVLKSEEAMANLQFLIPHNVGRLKEAMTILKEIENGDKTP